MASPTSGPHRQDPPRVPLGMDLFDSPVHLGLTPSLLFHATGAVTFVGDEAAFGGWDDDTGLLAVPA